MVQILELLRSGLDHSLNVFDIHRFGKRMLYKVQSGLDVVRLQRSGHDESSHLTNGRLLFIYLAGFLEEYFTQDLFFLLVCVVILHVIVMGLVKYC